MIRTALGAVADFIRDGTHGSPERTEAGVPVLSAMNVKGGRLNFETDRFTSNDEFAAFSRRVPLSDGDVLLTIVGTIGRAAVIEEVRPLVFQRSVAIIRPKAAVLDSRFLYHATQSSDFQTQLDRASNKSSQAGVYLGKLAEVLIPLPSLAEQRRIAAILDQADALRAKRREALAQLDRLTQAIFIDMFGDPRSNSRNWPESTLGEIGLVQGGLQLTSTRSALPVEVPYLRVANVYRDRLDLAEVKRFGVTPSELERTRLQANDLLIVEGHGNPNEIGRCAMWDASIDNCSHQNHLIRLRVDREKAEPWFVSAFLNSNGGRRGLINSANTTSGLNTISLSKVRSCRVLLPPLVLQTEFVGRLRSIRELSRVGQEAEMQANSLFASLQHRAFRGEL